MMFRKIGFDRALGVVAIIIGLVCLIESRRLFPIGNTFLSGDHALPGLTGLAVVMLGLLLLFVVKPASVKVVFPERPLMMRLMMILGILVAYSGCIAYLGYVIPTALFGVVLFRLFGDYRWLTCVATSIVCTTALYALFVLGLGMSFPRGLFF
jgi:putative tricarboxylic transport membrane protein